MLILRMSKENRSFVRQKLSRFRKSVKQGLIIGNIAYSDTATYFIVPDEALSAAFLYSIYLKAKEYGLRPEVMYAISIDPDKVFPDNVKRIGESWTYGGLSKNEIESLKNKWITPSLLEVLVK